MKTTQIQPRNEIDVKQPLDYPAIFLGRDDDGILNGQVVFAWTSTKGVVIHTPAATSSPLVGHIYEDPIQWDRSRYWVRSTEPVTIKFQP